MIDVIVLGYIFAALVVYIVWVKVFKASFRQSYLAAILFPVTLTFMAYALLLAVLSAMMDDIYRMWGPHDQPRYSRGPK